MNDPNHDFVRYSSIYRVTIQLRPDHVRISLGKCYMFYQFSCSTPVLEINTNELGIVQAVRNVIDTSIVSEQYS